MNQVGLWFSKRSLIFQLLILSALVFSILVLFWVVIALVISGQFVSLEKVVPLALLGLPIGLVTMGINFLYHRKSNSGFVPMVVICVLASFVKVPPQINFVPEIVVTISVVQLGLQLGILCFITWIMNFFLRHLHKFDLFNPRWQPN